MRRLLVPLALVCALVCGCSSFMTPQRATAIGRDVLDTAAALGLSSPEASRRFEVARAALGAVQAAKDDRQLQAAAPCAVSALRAFEPDVQEEHLIDSLRAVERALEELGGTCDVGRNDDAGVPPR